MAVVGHVEWVDFAHVDEIPRPGDIAHGRGHLSEPAGGGAVAAVQLARLAGEALLVTALGTDALAERTIHRLQELGVRVIAARREQPTRRAVTLLDKTGERTILTLGDRLEPHGEDDLDWDELAGADGVYFTAGDLGALRIASEAARVLVASPRARDALGQGVELDALVLSADDSDELAYAEKALGDARLTVVTEGERGGRFLGRDGTRQRWEAVDPEGPEVDSYGCGDSFAAGLTYGLAAGLDDAGAISLAARCGARCLTGSGPYERQLSAVDLATTRGL